MLTIKLIGRALLLGVIYTISLGCNETTDETTDRTAPGGTDVVPDVTPTTPLDQNANPEDVKITADIRRRIDDARMSLDPEGIKIITLDGKVTLQGHVHTAEEKNQIDQFAKDVAGDGNVTSQLEIETK